MSKLFGGKDPFDDPFFTHPFGGIFGGKNPFDYPFFAHPFDNQSGSKKEITIEEIISEDDTQNRSMPSKELVVKNPNANANGTQSFRGKNPFNDPFFTNPFDSQSGSKKEISIEELNSEDGTQNHSMPSKELVVKNPTDNANGTQSFSFQRVAYGGLNGMYYTSSIGRRTGGDGVILVDIKEDDKTVGQALHTISKGIRNKGHSVTTKHNPDGRVDTMKTLHNMGEDELAGFEETWKVDADRHLPGWSNGFNLLENAGASSSGWDGPAAWGGWALPWTDHSGSDGISMEPEGEARALPSRGRAKKVVPINIE